MFINCLPNLLLLEIDEKRQFQLKLRFNTQIITTEVILLCVAIAKRARNQKQFQSVLMINRFDIDQQ